MLLWQIHYSGNPATPRHSFRCILATDNDSAWQIGLDVLAPRFRHESCNYTELQYYTKSYNYTDLQYYTSLQYNNSFQYSISLQYSTEYCVYKW